MTRYVLKGRKLSSVLNHYDVIVDKLFKLKSKFPQMDYITDLTMNNAFRIKSWVITIEVNDGEQEITEFRKGVTAY